VLVGILCLAPGKLNTQKHQYTDNIFNAIYDSSSLQVTIITSVINCIENVVRILKFFDWLTFQSLNEEYLIILIALFKVFQTLPFLCCHIFFEHFGENCVTLRLTVVKLRRNLCALFLDVIFTGRYRGVGHVPAKKS